MNILLTADLHLLHATQERTLAVLASWVREFQPEAMVVAGDLASAGQAGNALAALRRIFPKGWLAICLGNHDFWMHDDARRACADLDQAIDDFWLPAAGSTGVTLLDRQNLELPAICLVGGYGHYDLGFAVPGLAYGRVKVVEGDYLRGWHPEVSALRWRDFQLMPGKVADVRGRAALEVARFERRLLAAGEKPVLAVTHTAPFSELLGIPELPAAPPPARAFFRAYLGNRAMGDMLRRHAHRLAGIVCGHTHRAAGPVVIPGLGVPGVNVGSDYGAPRAILYTPENGRFWRIPEPSGG